jgi:hypothetical protein
VHSAATPGALIVAALAVPVACGPARDPNAAGTAKVSSARVRDMTKDEQVGAVHTTHYGVVLSDDADDPEAWLDVWIDANDVIHRLSRPGAEASPRARDYFDFGVEVHVTPPCRPAGQVGSSTSLRQKDRRLMPCVEEGE